MAIRKRQRHYDDPIRHPMHTRPRTRREFLAQGFLSGAGITVGPSLLSCFPRHAYADLDTLVAQDCPSLANLGGGKIPFIGFDLAGGSSVANSNVLIGGPLGQEDFITTAGYERQGLPGDMVPSATNTTNPQPGRTDHINDQLGLLFHSDSAFLRGILAMTTDTTRQNIDGCVVAARSDNDTGNNPHNPMGGIAAYGANGQLTQLVGSENTPSGGNSTGPAMMVPLGPTPTKVDRRTDVTGLVDVGDLNTVLTDPNDVNAVMESIYLVSRDKVGAVKNDLAPSSEERDAIEHLVRCGYLKSAKLAKEFSDPIDPFLDQDILNLRQTFINEMNNLNGDPREREFEKTASVMKLVINGYAGAGTIEMGGYDYHGGARSEGEQKDFRAGLCMGACLEYAAITGVPLMLYVFSDGSLSSNGVIDNSVLGRGKLEWSSDNSQTAATWFLVYNPGPSTPVLRRQIGWMRPNGSVETNAHPGANNVNLLAEMVVLNYLALHGDQGQLQTVLPFTGLNTSMLDNWIGIGDIGWNPA